MAITIKKKRMTVKTVKAKGQLPPDADAETTAAPEEAAAPLAAPPQPVGRPRKDGKIYTLSVIFAIIAILMFIGLVTLQALELSFYYQPRPVFIRMNAPPGGAAPAPYRPPPETSTTDAE